MHQKDDIDTFVKLFSNCQQLQSSYLNFLKRIQEQLSYVEDSYHRSLKWFTNSLKVSLFTVSQAGCVNNWIIE